ncbi:MAG: hypothetical protein NC830_07015 [Candidatus Omnitrophica bacterium]|nr:hypothetical protein [Candidatus Omnitrophota bacterium]
MKMARLPFFLLICLSCLCFSQGKQTSEKLVAAIISDWFRYSHPDAILSRILKTYTLDGNGQKSQLKLVSIYRDNPSEKDMTITLAQEYGFEISRSIEEALVSETGVLSVDGVFIITEHGKYPISEKGQVIRPNRKLFEEIVRVFKKNKRVVPVFIDKHIATEWDDIKWIYETSKKLKIPLMAGSSVPVSWRYPPVDVDVHSKLKEIVGISYHTLDGYGFHGLEMIQCLAEQRKGGETGIKSVQCLTGDKVWEAAGKLFDKVLFDMAIERTGRKVPEGKKLEDLVKEPVLFVINYYDGLRGFLFTLNGFANQWTAAWRYEDNMMESTLFKLDENLSTLMHFANQVLGIEKMILTGKPSWPVERTVLTSGALNALLISKANSGKIINTPHLRMKYKSGWRWQQPIFPN